MGPGGNSTGLFPTCKAHVAVRGRRDAKVVHQLVFGPVILGIIHHGDAQLVSLGLNRHFKRKPLHVDEFRKPILTVIVPGQVNRTAIDHPLQQPTLSREHIALQLAFGGEYDPVKVGRILVAKHQPYPIIVTAI